MTRSQLWVDCSKRLGKKQGSLSKTRRQVGVEQPSVARWEAGRPITDHYKEVIAPALGGGRRTLSLGIGWMRGTPPAITVEVGPVPTVIEASSSRTTLRFANAQLTLHGSDLDAGPSLKSWPGLSTSVLKLDCRHLLDCSTRHARSSEPV